MWTNARFVNIVIVIIIAVELAFCINKQIYYLHILLVYFSYSKSKHVIKLCVVFFPFKFSIVFTTYTNGLHKPDAAFTQHNRKNGDSCVGR